MPFLVRFFLFELPGVVVFFFGVIFGIVVRVFLGESLKWIVPFSVRSIQVR